MSTFFRSKTLTEEIRRFRVQADIWNADREIMRLFSADFTGSTSQDRTQWDGRTKSQCYSEGLQAAVYVLEYALARARDSLEAARESERRSLSGRRRKNNLRDSE